MRPSIVEPSSDNTDCLVDEDDGSIDGTDQGIGALPMGGPLQLNPVGGLAYTCAGNAATVEIANVTWKLTKA